MEVDPPEVNTEVDPPEVNTEVDPPKKWTWKWTPRPAKVSPLWMDQPGYSPPPLDGAAGVPPPSGWTSQGNPPLDGQARVHPPPDRLYIGRTSTGKRAVFLWEKDFYLYLICILVLKIYALMHYNKERFIVPCLTFILEWKGFNCLSFITFWSPVDCIFYQNDSILQQAVYLVM